jgi:iron(III) transport system permease protein
MYSIEAAAQLSLSLLLMVAVVLFLERHARRGRQFQESRARYRPMDGFILPPLQAALAFFCCLLPVVFGFVVPGAILLRYALVHYEASFSGGFADAALHSLTLSGIAAVVAVAIGLFMAYALRLQQSRPLRALAWVSSLGYGMPGAILAVGAVVPAAWLDNRIDAYMRDAFGISTGLLLSGTVVAVILGYVVRFLVLSFGTIESGLAKVTRNMDDAARALGHAPATVLRRVHFPILRGSMMTAGLLVFVDCMKELPMTLLLRPFNYETLSTFVYAFAKDELLEESALGALTIVAAGIGPVVLLTHAIRHSRPGQGAG